MENNEELKIRVEALELRVGELEKELKLSKTERPKTVEITKNLEGYGKITEIIRKAHFFCPGVNSGVYSKELVVYLWNYNAEGDWFKKESKKFCEITLNKGEMIELRNEINKILSLP